MPTTNYKSSWINEQHCGLEESLTLYLGIVNLFLKDFIVINSKSVSKGVGQACWYAHR